jgi:hypothetical protein
MRSIATAVESYRVDGSSYPLTAELASTYPGSPFTGREFGFGFMAYVGRLTTPIAYMTSIPKDIFNQGVAASRPGGFAYFEYWSEEDKAIFGTNGVNSYRYEFLPSTTMYLLWSWGPDQVPLDASLPPQVRDQVSIYNYYDPTNGTVSYGNIFRPGPGGSMAKGET